MARNKCFYSGKSFCGNLLPFPPKLTANEEFPAKSKLIGISEAFQSVVAIARRVASSDSTVLLRGESGTGKEMFARLIHEESKRSHGPFIALNCSSIPAELLESVMFGHAKGAFTGAGCDHTGKFTQAHGGTLFLDEIGDLPQMLQPRILRALQERVIEPVGGKAQQVDVRIVAATHCNLEVNVGRGLFREDLYYRLAVVPILIPALRERREDIPLLAEHFACIKSPRGKIEIGTCALAKLVNYDWPGNVRELENVMERVVTLSCGDKLEQKDLPLDIRYQGARHQTTVVRLPDEGYPLDDIVKDAIVQALVISRGNQVRAAELLRIPRYILVYRMGKYGLRSGSGSSGSRAEFSAMSKGPQGGQGDEDDE